jgi:hypothetical protein
LGIEHFGRAAADIGLGAIGEIAGALENAVQFLVPGALPDLHVAGAD